MAESSEASFPVVLIAASRGGRQAVSSVLGSLPLDIGAAIVVVQHRAELPGNVWHDILARVTTLPVKDVSPGQLLEPGVIYVAPATRHVHVLADARLALVDGRRVCGVLSSANPLFETAAQQLGPRAIAVVLTGYGRDGTDGVQAVKAAGGVVIAQNEQSSVDFGMPGAAIGTGAVDYVRSIEEIGPLVVDLVEQRRRPVTSVP